MQSSRTVSTEPTKQTVTNSKRGPRIRYHAEQIMDACKTKTSPIMGFGELQVWDEYLDFEDLSTRMVRNIINSHRALLVKCNGLEQQLEACQSEQTRHL